MPLLFSFDQDMELRKLSYKLLLVNSQLSLNSCSCVLGRVQEKTHTNSRFVGSHQPFLVTRGCFYLTQLRLKLITLVQCINYFLVTQSSMINIPSLDSQRLLLQVWREVTEKSKCSKIVLLRYLYYGCISLFVCVCLNSV